MTPKQKKFVIEYLQCFNATRSAVAAGYSERTARATASRLLTYDNIRAEIERALMESAMLASEVLMRLAAVARNEDHKHQIRALEILAKHHGLLDHTQRSVHYNLNLPDKIDWEKMSIDEIKALAEGQNPAEILSNRGPD